jgi:hypothetical protein
LREDTTEFRKHLPVIQSLASKALQPWHWEKVSELLGKIVDVDDLTLQALLDLDAAGHIEAIQEVNIYWLLALRFTRLQLSRFFFF